MLNYNVRQERIFNEDFKLISTKLKQENSYRVYYKVLEISKYIIRMYRNK